MLGALASSTAFGAASYTPPTATLENQLDQCRIKLADWESCPSGKTHEGKAIINSLNDKIGDLQARIEKANAAKTDAAPPGINPTAEANAALNSPASGNATVGSRLNIFA
jgi:hypothetical protein